MGYPSVGDGLPRDLFRTLAALAKGKSGINDPGYSALSSRDVSAQVPPFKLMFMSGVVKLTSGDTVWGWIDHSFHWGALTALDYHYWTQPLPTIFAWFADKHPEWFKKFSVAFCLVVEIIVPFFIWAPRRPRLIAAGLLIFL